MRAVLKAGGTAPAARLAKHGDRRIKHFLTETATPDGVLLIVPIGDERNDPMESAHLSALSAKHAGLDARIDAEKTRPAPDGTLIAQLKKQKLRIKEALQKH